MSKEYRGLLAALLTPYNKSGKVNYRELKKLVRHLINRGIDGFYVGGSTAETFLLSQEERKECLRAVLEENNGEKLVVAHVGHISTDFARDLAADAKKQSADAVSAISPFYFKFSFDEIKQYYFDIIDACQMPLFIYNFPDFSGFTFTPERLKALRKNKLVAGVKFTNSNFYDLERMKSENPGLAIWNGYDEMLLSGLAAGADGGIGSTYCCILPLIRGIYDNFLKGDIATARSYQKKANDIIALIAKYGVFRSIKAILGFEGFDMGPCRKPFAEIESAGVKELKAMYDSKNFRDCQVN
jgi:N-acetylneuraminate lyase